MSTIPSKEWMTVRDRASWAYVDGVDNFINFAVESDKMKLSTMFCPCRKCKNKSRSERTEIRRHLINNGVMKDYNTWYLHGEDYSFCKRQRKNQVVVEERVPVVDDVDIRISSNVSGKKLKTSRYNEASQIQVATVMGEEVKKCIKDLTRDVIDGLKSYINEVIDAKFNQNIVGPSTSDKGSNSVYQQVQMQNLDEEALSPSQDNNSEVYLANSKQKLVATGLLATDSHKDVCHGKPVPPNERKVFIIKVIDREEPMLHSQFEEKLTIRTWTTWYENQIIYM